MGGSTVPLSRARLHSFVRGWRLGAGGTRLRLGLYHRVVGLCSRDSKRGASPRADLLPPVRLCARVLHLSPRDRCFLFNVVSGSVAERDLCVPGYCIFPLVIAAFCSMLFQVLWLRVIFVCLGFTWSTGASVGFMSDVVPEDRKMLGVYPVWLFYVSIAWMILIA